MIETYWPQIVRIWIDGGVAMIPLLLVSLLLYGMAVQLLVYFLRRDYRRVPETTWSRWIENPDLGEGEMGEIIRYTQDEAGSLDEIQNRFSEVVAAKIPAIDRHLTVMSVMVAAAPLLGLLGTVLGMLVTFRALSLGGGKMAEMVAKGISEALITTEMGLLIAIPGLFMVYLIRRKKNEYEAFLARLESVTVQHFQRKLERV